MSQVGFSPGEETVPEIQSNTSVSELGRSFLELANPMKDVAFSVDATICRPRASEPNHKTTAYIVSALAMTLLSIIIQASQNKS